MLTLLCGEVRCLRIHGWFHMFDHLRHLRINPQLNACYADEDFIRIMCNYVPRQA